MATTASTGPTPDELKGVLSRPDASYEVVDGQIIEKPDMSIFAYVIALRLRDALRDFVRAHRLGVAAYEWVFVLDPARPLKRKPDAAFVSFGRWPEDREVPEEGDWEVVPDLAIEVLSPHDLSRETTRKVREYFRYGVRQVWVVHPDSREVHVYTMPKQVVIYDREDVLDGGEILPGFRLPVADLFRRTVGR